MPLLSSAYELVHQLSATGNSNIFLYRHVPSTDLVVIKMIPVTAPSVAQLQPDTAAYKEMHINNVVAKSAHDGIVSMRDAFVADDALHLVFEYCAGGDLLTKMTQAFSSSWTEADAVAVFKQVACAVSHLHSLEIAHGDISLENILVTTAKTQPGAPISVKLCDFGLAVVQTVTRYSGVGKLYYMGPEMHMRRPYNSLASDLWALGVLLFMLLTGRPFVERATMQDPTFNVFFQAQASDPSTGVKAVLDASPPRLPLSADAVDLLTRLLRPSPSERLPMAQVLAHPLLNQKADPIKLTHQSRQRRAVSSPTLRHNHFSRGPVLPRLPLSYFKSITTTM